MKRSILITILLLAVLGMLFLLNKPKMTASFITNRTFERSEDIFFVYEVVKYPSNVTIISVENPSNMTVGIVGDPWNLNFGVLPVGVNGKRFVNVANYKEPMSKIRVVCFGNICSLITFDKNNFILHEGEESQITVSLNTNLSNPGNYFGEIHILSEIPKNSLISSVLGWS